MTGSSLCLSPSPSSSLLSSLLARAGATQMFLTAAEHGHNPKVYARVVLPECGCARKMWLRTESTCPPNLLAPFSFSIPWKHIGRECGSLVSASDIWMAKQGYKALSVWQLPRKLQLVLLESMLKAKAPEESLFVVNPHQNDSRLPPKIEIVPAVASIEQLQIWMDLNS